MQGPTLLLMSHEQPGLLHELETGLVGSPEPSTSEELQY
jgi:hypothetical protein